MFSYPDAARYRVGPNYQQLPSNRPHSKVYNPYNRDGPGVINGNYGGDPDYVNSDFRPLAKTRHHQPTLHETWKGQAVAYSSQVTDKDFEQSKELWEIMKKEGGDNQLIDVVSGGLSKVKSEDIRKKAIGKCSFL